MIKGDTSQHIPKIQTFANDTKHSEQNKKQTNFTDGTSS